MANFSFKKQNKQKRSTQDSSSTDSHSVTKNNEIENVEEWEKQIWYWRTHIDVFIEEYFSTEDKPINFFPFQKMVVRSVGNCEFVDDVESRSLGKTFKMALALSALAILYPNNKILVVSKTVRQAILTIKYIEQFATDNSNFSREINLPIRVARDNAVVKFKSGSEIEALAMSVDGSNIRGLRRKIIYIDESAWVKSDVILSVLMPVLQYKRQVYWKYKDEGFEDFKSKLIQTSSAYLKSCEFYSRFKQTVSDMKNGDLTKFACALSYKAGIRYGIIDEQFVENQKNLMPSTSWEMEWNSRFIGATDGSYFPYQITEPCRTLENIEICQAKGSKSRYILSADIATSAATYADNACICVIKLSEKIDGTFNKYLVYIKTYHGYHLEALTEEIRKTCVRFPNIEKVIIDTNALGEGIISLLNTPFVDENNKEYAPFILDTFEKNSGNAIPIIRSIKADMKYNSRMATCTRLFLENKSLHLPVTSTLMRREVDTGEEKTDGRKKNLMVEEVAVYIETDALQYEMGNIMPKITVSGNVLYETATPSLHKDRYSALGMGLEYVFGLEEDNRDAKRTDNDFCVGTAYGW
jgi:hypothetical protein